ncbi:bifunctional 2-polyprenyl-6-hydroxyphenol methylase/3-demethylubiquinol 3-O-methyltransferase UbiG [Polynucleobacter sp. MWH-HuK1]|uniref:class I SAM-dependent methyltransferase n=1 Tax=Polynucleobacter sp. MWH-HuK1 TaxID=1743158 RepID=UPI001C0DA08F|nr:class I SAM-dependent methyltransferase [Polynucleobacter sp. MWH-HuK1]MBU3564427.1 class I SAM-dependent methyltransferase [Polynucleobacter sp. MWH-HuK1]
MAQITHGIRAILSHPSIYRVFQSMMGAHQGRKWFVENFVKSFPGMKVLDIGCGPADILAYMPGVDYYGFDVDGAYIKHAHKKFGPRGKFHCKQLQITDLESLPLFDIVLALGLLHHLDDSVAADVIRLATKALKPGGRFLTIDPCFDPLQNPIARLLIRGDRGQNIRDKTGYEALASVFFESPRVEVHHRAWIPYTHCIMVCQQ